MMWPREDPRPFGPEPASPKTFVATTTSSRLTPRFFSACPVIRSDAPSEYVSAVSMKLIPASSARASSASASACSTVPITLNAPLAPKVIVPKHSSDTNSPVEPSLL